MNDDVIGGLIVGFFIGVILYIFIPQIICRKLNIEGRYYQGCVSCGLIIFCTSYVACIATYDFIFGVGLGWLPSLMMALIFCWLWPVIVTGCVLSLIYSLFHML
jgi:hypothetical protein